jgi:hypothetical protein
MAAGTTNFPTNLDSNSVATNATEITSTGYNNHSVQIEALEAKVGKDSSAVTTSHDYKLSGVTGSDKAVSKTGTETLTNKTLTSPVIDTGLTATGLLTNTMLSTTAGEIGGAGTTFTVTPTNLTVGNGTLTGYYNRIGKFTWGYIKMTFGSTSSVSGDVGLTLPVAPSSNYVASLSILGNANLVDNGTNQYGGVLLWTGGTTSLLRYDHVTSALIEHAVCSNTLPFTWTTSDSFNIRFSYEAA